MFRIALTEVPLVGHKTAKHLLDHFGSAEKIFEAPLSELNQVPKIRKTVPSEIINFQGFPRVKTELEFIKKEGIQALFYQDPAYPQRLTNFDDCPIILYYKGNADLNAQKIVSVVGTRMATERGRNHCEKLIEELKDQGVLVVSGLAYGIDIIAHKACLKNQVATVGVLGQGLDKTYPLEHKKTAQEMVSNGGLLTEFITQTKPDRENFPMRNRIIAGMCDALVVVESAEKGGSIITAELANQYHKDVFAFPGRVSDKFSVGCNRLIKIHKASLIENAKDIFYLLRWETKKRPGLQRNLFIELSEEEEMVNKILEEFGPTGMDALSYKTQLTTSKLSGVLLEMELKGIIKCLPGNRFTLY